jgi:hypothetical protein
MLVWLVVGTAGVAIIVIALMVLQDLGIWDWTPEDERDTRLWLQQQEWRGDRARR